MPREPGKLRGKARVERDVPLRAAREAEREGMGRPKPSSEPVLLVQVNEGFRFTVAKLPRMNGA